MGHLANNSHKSIELLSQLPDDVPGHESQSASITNKKKVELTGTDHSIYLFNITFVVGTCPHFGGGGGGVMTP